MDRASDSGSEGWGFESLPVYQIKKRIPIRVSSSLFRATRGKGLERLNAARMSAAGEGGAPRSESVIIMIASGNHSMILSTEPNLYLRKAQM